MADERARRDVNYVTLLMAITNNSAQEIRQLRVDSLTNRLLSDTVSEEIGHDAVGDGTRTIASANTRVQLSISSVACKRVWVGAHESNTGTVVVGAVTVVAALGTRRGTPLYPTQGDWFKVSNLNLLYIDSTAGGDKCNFYYEV